MRTARCLAPLRCSRPWPCACRQARPRPGRPATTLAGYYLGLTHRFRGGDGYRVGEATWLAGRASFVDGRLLDGEHAARGSVIEPRGERSDYGEASEALLLHSGVAAVSLRVTSARPATLGVLPLAHWARADYALQRRDAAVLQARGAPAARHARRHRPRCGCPPSCSRTRHPG